MTAPVAPSMCRRCQRPVEVSRDQFEAFEHMHYVCFHYEFEHDPVDPDEECTAGGCPSAAINPRPERRPATAGAPAAFGLSVRFTCKDQASAEAFDRLVAETVAQIRQHEPATLAYAVHTVEGKPLERIFYERYRDHAAFEAHEAQPHTRRMLAERGQFLTSVEVDRLTLQAGQD